MEINKHKLNSRLILIGLTVSFLLNLDPIDTGFGTDSISILRYISVILIISTLFFNSYKVTPRNQSILMIKALAIITMIGSLIYYIKNDINFSDTFFSLGLMIIVTVAVYKFIVLSNWAQIEVFSRNLLRLFLSFGIIYGAEILLLGLMGELGIGDGTKLFFHVAIPLVAVPIYIVYKTTFRINLLKYLGLVLLLTATIFINKNTSYITLIALFTMWAYIASDKLVNKLRGLIIRIGGVLIMFISVIYFYLWSSGEILPEGGTSVRYFTYSLRLHEFIESPIFGTFFTTNKMLTVGSENYNIVIPSHSDFLDVLAAGGVIACILFLFPIANTTFGRIKEEFLNYTNLTINLFRIFTFCWLVVLIFNSIGKPRIGLFFWFGVGFISGIKTLKYVISK